MYGIQKLTNAELVEAVRAEMATLINNRLSRDGCNVKFSLLQGSNIVHYSDGDLVITLNVEWQDKAGEK